MTDREILALQHVAAGVLLLRTGHPGDPPGYRWRRLDGTEAGQVPQPETDDLDRLLGHGLIAVEDRPGPAEHRLRITSTGIAALAGLRDAA